MALWRKEMARCKRCGKYGMMDHTNHRQTQMYCDLCRPIVKQEAINQAVEILVDCGLTPKDYKRFYDKHIKPKPPGEGERE